MADAVDRHLIFLHALQQRGLGARRHAVDFIHQQQVGEHRSGMEAVSAGCHVEDVGAQNVSRHQV